MYYLSLLLFMYPISYKLQNIVLEIFFLSTTDFYCTKTYYSCKNYCEKFEFVTIPSLYFSAMVLCVKTSWLMSNKLPVLWRINFSCEQKQSQFDDSHAPVIFPWKGTFYRTIKVYNMLQPSISNITNYYAFKNLLKEKCFYSFNFDYDIECSELLACVQRNSLVLRSVTCCYWNISKQKVL